MEEEKPIETGGSTGALSPGKCPVEVPVQSGAPVEAPVPPPKEVAVLPEENYSDEPQPRKVPPPIFKSRFSAPLKERCPDDVRRVVFLDFETNGLGKCSVLSASATLVEVWRGAFFPVATFDRYYYPREPFNREAVEINGLTREEIDRRRGPTCEYVAFFEEDDDWLEFCAKGEIFVAHNFNFDRRFMRFDPNRFFCTMYANANIVKESWDEEHKNWKWPKLHKTAEFYGIPVAEATLHQGKYDVHLCLSIFQEMYKKGLPCVLELFRRG